MCLLFPPKRRNELGTLNMIFWTPGFELQAGRKQPWQLHANSPKMFRNLCKMDQNTKKYKSYALLECIKSFCMYTEG